MSAPVMAGTERALLLPAYVWALIALALAAAWLLTSLIGAACRARRKSAEPLADASGVPEVGALCGIGLRDNQEDSYAVSDPSDAALVQKHGLLAVIADGMGGLDDGELVSAAVTDAFMRAFAALPDTLTPVQKLLHLSHLANMEARHAGGESDGRSGSTLAAALVQDGLLWFCAVGDSRVCLFRGGAPIQLTREHVYAAKLDLSAAYGLVSFEAAQEHRQRQALTSYMGMEEPEQIDFSLQPVRLLAGDWVLVMSDGVFHTLSDEEIALSLTGSAGEAAARLENAVLQKQAAYQDNFTAVLLRAT